MNHKDGNKENNHYSNLEWASRKNQTKHAFKNRLTKNRMDVIVTDLKTNETITFESIEEANRYIGCYGDQIVSNAKYSDINPLFGRYIIKIPSNLEAETTRSGRKAREWWVYDYFVKEWKKCVTTLQMCYNTTVSSAVVTRDMVRGHHEYRVYNRFLVSKTKLDNPESYFKFKPDEYSFIARPRVAATFETYVINVRGHCLEVPNEDQLLIALNKLGHKVTNRDVAHMIYKTRCGEFENEKFKLEIKRHQLFGIARPRDEYRDSFHMV